MKGQCFFVVLFASILSLTSCGDEKFNVPENLIGTWKGISHGDTGTAYLTVSFGSDMTGELELEYPTGSNLAYFEYTVSGYSITCKGTSANTNGSTNNNFSMTFQLENDRLIPQNQWTQFILTKDGSIETNVNGDIVSDQSEQLQNVWINESGYYILYFKDSENVIEYGLYEQNSNKYTSAKTFQYYYDYKCNELDLYRGVNSYFFTINELDSESLVMTSQNSGTIYKYKCGSKSDIPTEFIITW